MKAKSIKGKSVTELKSALAETITADFKPTLAVVFSSVSQDLKGICDVVDAESIAIFGCTTNGEFIDEQTETGSWVMLLMDLNPDYFQIHLEEYPDKNYREAARITAEKVGVSFKTPAFLMSEELRFSVPGIWKKGIKKVWQVPMAGIFSSGELGRATGGNLELLNLTTCCVALKEK
jgi:hypothetical protein